MTGTAGWDIRPSPIAGRWYAGTEDALRGDIQGYLDKIPPMELSGRILGLIVPHAGHIYSGLIAAYAFKQIVGHVYKRVVILSPMHAPYKGSVLTSGHRAYETPLGVIPIDQVAVASLNSLFPLSTVRNDPEHSLEIELPFLQHCLAEPFSLVPLMLRAQDLRTSERLGDALASIFASELDQTLFVASTDLSHFYTAQQAKVHDDAMLERITAFDPVGVIRIEDENRGFACGRAAVASLLFAAKRMGASHVQLLKYGHSGEVSGDYSGVVGYGAAAVLM